MARKHAPGTLLLAQRDVRALLDLDACIAAVDRAFRLHGEGVLPPPALLGIHAPLGGLHVKAAVYDDGGRRYLAAKANANFMGNPPGTPTIQGVVLLADGDDGRLLAAMDSIAITALRTGAATAVAARLLARTDAATLAVVGCGTQGRVQLRAVSRVRALRRVWACDADPAAAERFAADMGRELGIPVTAQSDHRSAARQADMCVTCTPSHEFLLGPEDVPAGAFVAGVGADSEHKRELTPDLLAAATVVTDVREQCAAIGDLHHALDAGVMTRAQVHADLGAIVAGQAPGRRRDDEVIVFDSTGMALQDAAAAVVVYERALAAGRGSAFDFTAA